MDWFLFSLQDMTGNESYITRHYKIKNLVCDSAVLLLKEVLSSRGYVIYQLTLGSITVSFDPVFLSEKELHALLQRHGMDIIEDKEEQLVEDIKLAVIELIHRLNNMNSIIRKSDYLVEKLGKSYQQLSKTFSAHEAITLEKYIILQKIERIKELIDHDDYTLSEISYMMDYSSVQYLSNQFKQIAGVSVSDYKKGSSNYKKSLSNLSARK